MLSLEKKIWKILFILKTNSDISKQVMEWFTQSKALSIMKFECLFKEDELRRTLRQSMILEVLSFSLTYYIICEQWSLPMMTHIRNLIFNIHQNYVTFLFFVSQKLPSDSKQNVIY